jgi:hypothetical protein
VSKLREWLERAKLAGGKDAASFARVQAACVAIVQALDTVPGLTEAERAQALTTLGAHQTMRNLMTSGILSEVGKRAADRELTKCPECGKPWVDCPHEPPKAGPRERE